ncbi:hypothetical protein D3C76_1415220 [compost metagenome]
MDITLVQQLRSRAEIIGQLALVLVKLASSGLPLINDKATADGVVGFAQQGLVIGKCAQGHGVGMVFQVFFQQSHVPLPDKRHTELAGQ